ncbi:MAG: 2-succinyl-6-hydroxy-2,4-cyclohexadiene-1-carboxylate synthase [Candidatus Palauibacterales bacterium]|nr:2-succinyl-6-hydroxy-2,4-cyclohexadiene-1-carboxylate synthase [Candidatus Palauibacterales bacterium]MDP2585143.1 2-succinyl-6-hydroxy-2,4-cyclohexadiene-1-carboxylate synthase [Candidatus Palauibacterales bacterium]
MSRTTARAHRIALRDGFHVRLSERGGDGTALPVVLLHGFTGSVEAWGEELVEGLVATGRRVVAVDLLGHGGSDVPAEPSRYAMERQIADLEEVLDELGVERAAWVGYSMGARLALGRAVLQPERVAALVLESGSPGLATGPERRARRAADEALAARLEDAGPEAMARFVDDWMARPLFDTQRRLPDEVRRRERRRRLDAHPRGLAGTLRGFGTGAQPSLWERLDEVEPPALLLTGRLDAKFEAIADRMAARMSASVRASVPDAGHAVHLERPEAWLARVSAFLAEAGAT